MSKAALIVVDVQNDFISGALKVPGAYDVLPWISELMESKYFPVMVGTQDWHPVNHCSFKDQGGPWPLHCTIGSRGADFSEQLLYEEFHAIIRKGYRQDIDSYSGFVENDRKTHTGLNGFLRDIGVTDVYICGLALDYCVSYTAADAANLGFKTFIIQDACAAIDAASWTPPEGVTLLTTADIPYERPSQELDLDSQVLDLDRE